MRAKQLIEEGRANSDHRGAATEGDAGETPPTLGSEEARAGIVTAGLEAATPGDPEPLPPTNTEGFATIPSEDRAAAGALGDNSAAPNPWRRPAASEAEPIRARNRKETVRGSHLCPAGGTQQMDDPPSSWSKTDEEVDEFFPASDPPGNY